MRIFLLFAATLPASLLFADTAQDDGWKDTFPIDSYTMVAKGGNPYWSLKPGRFVVLGNLEPGGGEFVVISVLDEIELVNGVKTRVIEEREYENGSLTEISRNFFAMAKETKDIFYFGEDVDYYEDGKIIGHGGQWRAGEGDARAGLYMPGLVVRQVDQLTDMKLVFGAETLDDVGTPFGATIFGLHRVQDDAPVRMKADPVVRKNRIRRVRFIRVVDNDNVDPVVS